MKTLDAFFLDLYILWCSSLFLNFLSHCRPLIVAGFEISQMAAQAKAVASEGKCPFFSGFRSVSMLKESGTLARDLFGKNNFSKIFEVFLRHHE